MAESLSIRYTDPLGIYEPAVTRSLGSNVRFGTLGVSQSAELGQASISTIEVDDPGGILNIVGLRAIVASETAAPSNNQVVFRGVTQDRVYKRSPERSLITGADRLIAVDATDYNWHLGSRRFVDADANRPAETPGARIAWLLSSAAHITLFDYGNVTYPTSPVLEATDYRTQTPMELLADCCVEGQYNFWCDVNEAHGRPELFFIDPDSTDYASELRVSNVLSDVDSVGTFAPYEDAELRRSPSRIAYGAMVAHPGGWVYERDEDTGRQFGKLDQVAPMQNVKSAARARRLARVFLDKNGEESDRLSFSIKVPAAQVNGIRAGHLLPVRFSHLPGYEDWAYVRVLRRDVVQEDEGGQDYYLIKMDAVPVSVAAISVAPSVSWIYYNETGDGFTGTLTIQASDDGASWADIVSDAELRAGTVNPPNVDPVTQAGLVGFDVSRYRYWRIRSVINHPGGYFAGVVIDYFRLLSGSDYDAVDRLGLPSQGFPTYWWEGDIYGADTVPWTAACSGAHLGQFPYVTTDTGTMGIGFAPWLGPGVYGPETITTTWTWDLLG